MEKKSQTKAKGPVQIPAQGPLFGENTNKLPSATLSLRGADSNGNEKLDEGQKSYATATASGAESETPKGGYNLRRQRSKTEAAPEKQVKLQMAEERERRLDDIEVTFHCLLHPILASHPDFEVYIMFGPPIGDWETMHARMMPSEKSPYATRSGLMYLTGVVSVPKESMKKMIPYKYFFKIPSKNLEKFEYLYKSQHVDYNRCLILPAGTGESEDVYDDLVCGRVPASKYFDVVRDCAEGRTDSAKTMLSTVVSQMQKGLPMEDAMRKITKILSDYAGIGNGKGRIVMESMPPHRSARLDLYSQCRLFGPRM